MDGGIAFGTERRWYAVRSQPRKEQLAETHLKRQGFAAFLPKISTVVRRPTRTMAVSAPFFPGYLFVSLDLAADRWRSVNGTIGVLNLVCLGDRPSPAPSGLVNELIARATEDGEVRFDQSFNRGDQVRVVGGPLNGHVGRFEALGPSERVIILLQMLNQETRVEVPKSAIMAA